MDKIIAYLWKSGDMSDPLRGGLTGYKCSCGQENWAWDDELEKPVTCGKCKKESLVELAKNP